MGDGTKFFEYHEAVRIEQALTSQEQKELKRLTRRPTVTPKRFAVKSASSENEIDSDKTLAGLFDVSLYFHNSGPRKIAFRVPLDEVSLERVTPFLVQDKGGYNGLMAEVDDEDLILRFCIYGEDNELFNLGETGEGWLDRIAPLWAEIRSGDLSALEIGRLILNDEWERADDESCFLGTEKLTVAGHTLAGFMLVPMDSLWSEEDEYEDDDS